MSMTKMNTVPSSDSESFSESSEPQSDLGWEGHVHFQENPSLGVRLLETYP